MNSTLQHISRQDLAKRWGVSVRTVDRARQTGRLPWIDISGGQGARPLVRFLLADIEEYEHRMRQAIVV